VCRQDFSRNVEIGSSSHFENFSKCGWFKHWSRVMDNWKINITTGSRTWERSMNLGDLILEMSGKGIAE